MKRFLTVRNIDLAFILPHQHFKQCNALVSRLSLNGVIGQILLDFAHLGLRGLKLAEPFPKLGF